MLTEICQYLKNWFTRKPDGSTFPVYDGTFTIRSGILVLDELADGQYFRIIGSLFNDGVHTTDDDLIDETFDGSVWLMGVPPIVVQLAADISQWQALYGRTDGAAMSPYTSESFGGYSYSKSGGGSTGDPTAGTWQTAFATRLAPWRKI